MTYDATQLGVWVVALKVEDFEHAWQTVALSGTSLQFIVNVTAVNSLCLTRNPLFQGH